MTSVLPYLLAILLIPTAIGLMLFAMSRIEDQPPANPSTRLPHAP